MKWVATEEGGSLERPLFFGSGCLDGYGEHSEGEEIPRPLIKEYNTRSPRILLGKDAETGSEIILMRWYGEVANNKEASTKIAGCQYLFPLLLSPQSTTLFPKGARSEINSLVVLDVDCGQLAQVVVPSEEPERWYMKYPVHDRTKIWFSDRVPPMAVETELVVLAYPSFGVISPLWYADQGRGSVPTTYTISKIG